MKPPLASLAAFLSIELALGAGWLCFGLLYLGPGLGRDFLPILLFCAFFLLGSGAIYGRWPHASFGATALGIAAHAVLVWVVVAVFSGSWQLDDFTMGWIMPLLLATVLPWLLGLWAGRYSRRFQLTP